MELERDRLGEQRKEKEREGKEITKRKIERN